MNYKIQHILLIFVSVFSYGQVSVFTEISTKDAKLNEPILLTIVQEVLGNQSVQETPLRLPDLSKFNIVGSASEQNTFIDQEKGIRVNQLIYQLYLQPKQTGRIKIGSALITVNGKIYKSEPFDISVKEAERRTDNTDNLAINDIYLNLEVEDKVVYENQPTVAVLRAYSKNFDNFRKVENIKVSPQNNVNIHPISYKKQDIETTEKGELSSQVIAMFIIFPEKAGNVEIEPVSASLKTTEFSKILSNKVKLNVKNLPQGSPKDFKKAVGKFAVDIIHKTTDKLIEINKPIQVLVKFSGQGNLNISKLPKLVNSDDYTFFKPKITSNLSPNKEGLSGEIIAEYTLIPKKTGVLPINVESFSFFNPSINQYIELGKKTLKINVWSAEEIAAQKSTFEVVDEYTKNVAEAIDLPVISEVVQVQKKSKRGIGWLLVLGNITMFAAIASGIYLIFNRKNKQKNKVLQKNKPITTVSEEEQLIKQSLQPDVSSYLDYLDHQKNQQNYSGFFKTYDELNEDIERQILEKYKVDVKTYIDQNKSAKFAEEYRDLQHIMQIEKYAPVHDAQHLDEIYLRIKHIFTEIIS